MSRTVTVQKHKNGKTFTDWTPYELAVAKIKPSAFVEYREGSERTALNATTKDTRILQTIGVRPNKSGPFDFEVIWGDGRLETAKRQKHKTIWAVYHPCDDKEARRLHGTENFGHDHITLLGQGHLFSDYRDDGYSNAEISKMFGISEGTVQFAISTWRKTSPDAKRAILKGKVQEGYIPRILQICGDDTKLGNKVILFAAKGKVDLNDIVKVAELTPQGDMKRILEKAVSGDVDVREIHDAAVQNAMAKTAHELVKDTFHKESQSERLLSTGGSMVGVGSLSHEDLASRLEQDSTEVKPLKGFEDLVDITDDVKVLFSIFNIVCDDCHGHKFTAKPSLSDLKKRAHEAVLAATTLETKYVGA